MSARIDPDLSLCEVNRTVILGIAKRLKAQRVRVCRTASLNVCRGKIERL